MPHRIFAPASRYPPDPRAVFVLGLCVAAGLPLAIGVTEPQSIASLMPTWVVVVWGSILAAGSAVTLVGMSRQTANGIITEQVGSVAVGAATVFYGAAILLVAGWAGLAVTPFVFGWGISCFWRWGQLQSLINTAVAKAADGDS